MNLKDLQKLEYSSLDWTGYDLIVLASGFEARSTNLLLQIPESVLDRVLVLGFAGDRNTLSRPQNDRIFGERGLSPEVCDSQLAYEALLRERLLHASHRRAKPTRILIDYSVMTRSWYGMILTWLRYGARDDTVEADFVYSHGQYLSQFEPLHIESVAAIPGFEGYCAGSRSTAAVFGLGYDKYAVLALYELIEPDSVVCFLAQESRDDDRTKRAIQENSEIIRLSRRDPLRVPLSNVSEIYRLLYEAMTSIPTDCEIVAVPMGPKPHVLATLLIAQAIPRVTCLHASGYRHHPVEVHATGEVSAWRLVYT